MAASTPHTIVLRSNNPDNAVQRVREALANSAITPGELLEWGATVGDVQAHGTAGASAEGKKVAIENPWSDHGTGLAIDHDYADNETVRYIFAQTGDQLYMFLADTENVSQGDALQSDGNGDLQAHTAQAVDEGGTATFTIESDAIVGYAAEDLNNSAGGARARIKVDIA